MVYLILGAGFEEAEAIVPCDLLRRAGVEVRLAGIGGTDIPGSHGIPVHADCAAEAAELTKADMLILPGGLGGVRSIRGCEPVLRAAREMAQAGKWVAAICAAPTVLAELGLLLADPTYTPEAEVDPAAPAITYYKADSRQAEAKAVAAAVKARARAGVPYNKMAVICRTVDQYLLQIRYEFRLQNIPLFCDEPTTPENTAPARAIHAALDLLRGGLTTTALLRLLKTGLVDLDRDSQCALENYAYTWPLHAQDWREPFTRNPEGYTDRMSEQSQQDLQRAEEARSFLVPRVQKFMDRARNADTATLTAQIYYFLQSLGAEEALQKLTDGLRACGNLPNADEALREWNVITELLDQMVHLLPAGEPITPADYDDLFTLLLRTTDMGHIPQSMDSVIFTTAGRNTRRCA